MCMKYELCRQTDSRFTFCNNIIEWVLWLTTMLFLQCAQNEIFMPKGSRDINHIILELVFTKHKSVDLLGSELI